jgi:hypothetical protein
MIDIVENGEHWSLRREKPGVNLPRILLEVNHDL